MKCEVFQQNEVTPITWRNFTQNSMLLPTVTWRVKQCIPELQQVF